MVETFTFVDQERSELRDRRLGLGNLHRVVHPKHPQPARTSLLNLQAGLKRRLLQHLHALLSAGVRWQGPTYRGSRRSIRNRHRTRSRARAAAKRNRNPMSLRPLTRSLIRRARRLVLRLPIRHRHVVKRLEGWRTNVVVVVGDMAFAVRQPSRLQSLVLTEILAADIQLRSVRGLSTRNHRPDIAIEVAPLRWPRRYLIRILRQLMLSVRKMA